MKVADTHGIVYTPQPIVRLYGALGGGAVAARVRPRRWATPGCTSLDPFVGTGNFIVRVMQAIPRTACRTSLAATLHCNEVMLLPYYIAALNIEHLYYGS